MSLDVYLHGERIGALFTTGGDAYSFGYLPETVAEEGAGAVLLSNALPVREEPYGPDATRAYVEGLLPQGRRRLEIARELDLDAGDGYGLIAELGGDCLGGVTFMPDGEEPEEADPEDLPWLTDAELEEVLQPRPPSLFDLEDPDRMRFVLPGERHKLALVRDEESGRWAWPSAGVPSTHIVKPEAPERPGAVAGEHACSVAYRELGLPVAHTAIETIAGVTCLVSKRFDRWADGSSVERLHQETFAQALGVPPDAADGRLCPGTPSLREVTGLLRAIGEEQMAEVLMKTTFCDLVIGCTRLRGGNSGLLFGEDGPMLAPFSGTVSTEVYGESRPRPIVIGPDVPPAPLLIDIRHTSELCEKQFQPALIEAVKLMGPLCVALGAQAERAQEEGWYERAIDEAIGIATSRGIGFKEEVAYLRPPGEAPPP
jgi:serine/threonine-protein kinase HipA